MPTQHDAMHVPAAFASVDWGLIHRLDSVTQGIFDCPHSTPELAPDGPLIVRTQDILSGVLRVEEAARVKEETYRQRIVRAEPAYGDLLYSREGTYFGIAAEVPRDTRVCLGQRMVLIRPDPSKLNHRYLKFWLNSPQIAAHIQGFRDGSVAERLNMSTIRALPVYARPLSEQQAIAGVLGALDDKIEQNRRTAEALERLARAIFRAWFVDFEPVKAKAAGATAFPSMPQHAFDALPTRFVESEIGPVPVGWQIKPLSEACTLVSGGTPKRSEPSYWSGQIPWYSVKDAPGTGEVWVIETSECITEPGLANSAAKLVPKGCTIISARGTVGKLAMAGTPMAFNQSCYGLLPNDGESFGYLHLLMQMTVSNLQQRTHGSVFDTITRATFDGLVVVEPAEDLVEAFEASVAPLLDLILASVNESRRLSGLRDYLLPKLLSGTVRVSDAKRMSGIAQ